MLISVHLPKTAGTSFRASLEKHFGSSLKADYQDIPINLPTWKRNSMALCNAVSHTFNDFSGTECIHGHFLPVKYRLLEIKRPLTYVTWLRNPVERVISHYYFWKTHLPPVLPPLHAKMVREEWTLERFCLGTEMKNLYHQFLWGFPIEKFIFIGITENYAEDFGWFSRNYLGSESSDLVLNTTEYPESKTVTGEFLKAIAIHHKKDIELYTTALELRKKRLH
jgi:hypothetical protein